MVPWLSNQIPVLLFWRKGLFTKERDVSRAPLSRTCLKMDHDGIRPAWES
jgi:hypothetical protein